MKLMPFEILVLCHPSDDEDSNDTQIIVEPRVVLAKDSEAAILKASRLIPDEYSNYIDKGSIQVACRPF